MYLLGIWIPIYSTVSTYRERSGAVAVRKSEWNATNNVGSGSCYIDQQIEGKGHEKQLVL